MWDAKEKKKRRRGGDEKDEVEATPAKSLGAFLCAHPLIGLIAAPNGALNFFIAWPS
jgi:hypothetical protein